jgi:hypothetical protein
MPVHCKGVGMNVEELKTLIVANLDVVDFLDLIDMELADLVEIPEIGERIEEEQTRLYRAVG